VFKCVLIVFFSVNCVFYEFLQYFYTVGWVFWPVKTVARITYAVLETKPCSINQSLLFMLTMVTMKLKPYPHDELVFTRPSILVSIWLPSLMCLPKIQMGAIIYNSDYEGWSISNEKNIEAHDCHQIHFIVFQCDLLQVQHIFPIDVPASLHRPRRTFRRAL